MGPCRAVPGRAGPHGSSCSVQTCGARAGERVVPAELLPSHHHTGDYSVCVNV